MRFVQIMTKSAGWYFWGYFCRFWSKKMFFFKTPGQIDLIFSVQVPRGDLSQLSSNCEDIYNFCIFEAIFCCFWLKNLFLKNYLSDSFLCTLAYKSRGMTYDWFVYTVRKASILYILANSFSLWPEMTYTNLGYVVRQY